MKTSQWLSLFGLITVMAGTSWGQPAPEEELESQLVGIELARSDGTFLGLAVEGNALVLRFYDEEQQLIDPDAHRAAVWWNPPNKPGRERTVMNLAGQSLRSPAKVRPPYVYIVTITLIDENETSVATHRFSLLDLPKPEEEPPLPPGVPAPY